MRRWALGLVLATCFFLGTAFGEWRFKTTRIVHVYRGVEVVSLVDEPSIANAVDYWKRETARRFPNALVIICHGNDFLGEWIALPTHSAPVRTVELVNRAKQEHPDRIIVLVSCNPGGYHLKIPGVYHALADVWVYPDRYSPDGTLDRTEAYAEAVGNIYEFVDD